MPDKPSSRSRGLPAPILVADPAGLQAMVDDLAGEPAVAVDTESNSLYAYREQVCLVQFSTPKRDYIVDPLALPDLNALAPLFANPRQQKIFHAAEYDLICLKRDHGFEIAGIFDTMIAARTLGWPQMGLAAILAEHFKVTMNKRHQRANWGQRPLTAEQLDYARLDTHYLLPLRDILLAGLQAAERVEEAREEFERITRVSVEPNHYEPQDFWRVNGARDLAPQEAAVLQALHAYREQQAERADRPTFKVMSDKTLLEIARQAPGHVNELRGLPGMTPGQIKRHGAALVRAVQRGLAAPPQRPPQTERPPDSVRERYDLLHRWRKRKARARGVESDVILPRDVLWALAQRVPRTLDDLKTIEALGPWRRRTYGAEILEVLHGS